jgi:hypothetical protein
MSRALRLLIAAVFGLAATVSATAQTTPFLAPMVPFPQGVGSVTPPPTGAALLLVDGGTDTLTLIDGTNQCLATNFSC